MPVLRSAKKALRRDRRRGKINLKIRHRVKMAIKAVRKNPTKKTLTQAFSWLDKAAKKNIFHKNKASRLKSRLAKLVKSGDKTRPTIKKKTKKLKKKTS